MMPVEQIICVTTQKGMINTYSASNVINSDFPVDAPVSHLLSAAAKMKARDTWDAKQIARFLDEAFLYKSDSKKETGRPEPAYYTMVLDENQAATAKHCHFSDRLDTIRRHLENINGENLGSVKWATILSDLIERTDRLVMLYEDDMQKLMTVDGFIRQLRPYTAYYISADIIKLEEDKKGE